MRSAARGVAAALVVVLLLPLSLALADAALAGRPLAPAFESLSPQWYARSIGLALLAGVATAALATALGFAIARRLRTTGRTGFAVPAILLGIAFWWFVTRIIPTAAPVLTVVADGLAVLPLVVLLADRAGAALDPSARRALESLGASRWFLFRRAVLPSAATPVAAAALAAFAVGYGDALTAGVGGGAGIAVAALALLGPGGRRAHAGEPA